MNWEKNVPRTLRLLASYNEGDSHGNHGDGHLDWRLLVDSARNVWGDAVMGVWHARTYHHTIENVVHEIKVSL